MLILASSSPRRKELLTEAGYEFQVIEPAPEAECGVCSGESPPQFAARMAFQKAADVARRAPPGIVVACDTIAECQGQILGKPHDETHAREMLRMLRGREHRVFSGLCVWPVPAGPGRVEVDCTRLRMAPLGDEAIEAYLATDGWVGKAGAFGYQDQLGWVEIISGSETNVVGLPMELLARMLGALTGP